MRPYSATKRLLCLSALLTLSTAFRGHAGAQEVSGGSVDERDVMEVVIVTARKREENLQDVPISITALTQDALRDANAFGLEDVAQLTPGLQFRQVGGISEPVIRGLAQTDQIGIQGNVGVFVDGIFLNNRASIEFGNLDLAQIEVLKGPQSALFGRNTFAGAINYTTRSATLGEFDATIEGEAGSHDRFGIKGSINVPLNDFSAVRVFGGRSQFDGTISNLRIPDDRVGGWNERITYGATALFDVDRVRVKVFYARNEIDEDQPTLNLIAGTDNTAGTNYVNDADPSVSFSSVFGGTIRNFENVDLFPGGTGNVGDFWLGYANVEVDLGFATGTGNYSRSESGYGALFDNIGNPVAQTQFLFGNPGFAPLSNLLLTNSTGDVGEQDSYEFRLTSNDGSPFDWLIGYSHYDGEAGIVTSSAVPLVGDPSTIEVITFVPERLSVKIDAFYGSFNFPITDRLNIGGEVRYTDEDQVQSNELDLQFLNIDNDPTFTPAEFEYWSGRASLDYAVSEDVLAYAYAARGVKSGGPNPGGMGEFATFDPETNWTYEIGVKAGIWDGRAIVNAAVYYIDWSDLQTTAPPSLGVGSVTVNGIGATSIGIELDATFRITDNFDLRLTTAYIDATYDDGFVDAAVSPYCAATLTAPAGFSISSRGCSDNVGGNKIARQGDFSFFASGTYTRPDFVFGFDGYVRADFSHEASPYPTSLNLAKPDDRNLVNLRFGIRNDNTELAFWIDNAFDTELIDRVTAVPDLTTSGMLACGTCINGLRVYPGNTRTWGVKAVQRF